MRRKWETAPNLVKGDFEHGHSAPAGWDPLPHDATWVVEKGKDAKAGNRIIRFTMNEDVAGSTGVLYYSNFFPVEEGATYRFQCRWRTTGSAAKVFIKCYDELPTSFRTRGRRFAQDREARGLPQPAKPAGICRSLECADRGFHAPAHPVYSPLGAGDAYAYWPAGSVEWDDVVVKQIAPAPRVSVRKIAGPRRKAKGLHQGNAGRPGGGSRPSACQEKRRVKRGGTSS